MPSTANHSTRVPGIWFPDAAAAAAAVGRELEGVRLELTGAQMRALVAVEDEATGQPGGAGAVLASQAEVERLVAEQARLRLLLSSMSRT